MGLTKYNDYRPISLDSILNDFFDYNVDKPQVDVSEDNDKYELEIFAAGMKKKDFKISVDDGKLIVSGERKKSGKKYNLYESYHGTFKRSFKLPENVLSDKIEASYIDGVLSLKLPKTEIVDKVKTISIK